MLTSQMESRGWWVGRISFVRVFGLSPEDGGWNRCLEAHRVRNDEYVPPVWPRVLGLFSFCSHGRTL